MHRGIARSARLAGFVLVALVTWGCGSSSGPTAPPTPPATLPGTSWILGIQAGTAPAAQNPATLVFGTDGSLSGFDGCSNFKGTFTTTGTSIAVAEVTTVAQQQCAPETVAGATAYRTALAAATGWQTTSASDVPLSTGITILTPVKLILSGPTVLAFSQG